MRFVLVTILIASVLVAAPVPSTVPEFGASGILTLDDLKSVAFTSRIARTEAEIEKLKLQRGEQPEDYDIAVHMPHARIRQGEPIPAYFVVKNKWNDRFYLRSWLDFTNTSPRIYGEASISLRNRSTDRPVEGTVLHTTRSNDQSYAELPANGYYVARGDLNRFADKPLPPGEYEIEWTCQLRAAVAKFTVLPADAIPKQTKLAPADYRYFTVVTNNPEAGNDERFHWKNHTLVAIEPDRMAGALAVGPFGSHIPDVRTIPASDGRVSVRATLRQDGADRKLMIVLESKDPKKPVEFDEVPHLYLQVEERKSTERKIKEDPTQRHYDKPRGPIRTPLTIEVPLDEEKWKNWDLASGRQMAAIVTNRKLGFPSATRAHAQARLMIESFRQPASDPAKVWVGVLRSEFIPLNGK